MMARRLADRTLLARAGDVAAAATLRPVLDDLIGRPRRQQQTPVALVAILSAAFAPRRILATRRGKRADRSSAERRNSARSGSARAQAQRSVRPGAPPAPPSSESAHPPERGRPPQPHGPGHRSPPPRRAPHPKSDTARLCPPPTERSPKQPICSKSGSDGGRVRALHIEGSRSGRRFGARSTVPASDTIGGSASLHGKQSGRSCTDRLGEGHEAQVGSRLVDRRCWIGGSGDEACRVV